jgi:signal transduction histidine kinase
MLSCHLPLHLRPGLWLRTCLLVWLCSLTWPSLALDNPVSAKEWQMDITGKASLAAVQASADWQPLPDWKSWGYGPEVLWIRLRLKAAATDTTTPWVVQVRPAYLDYVTLYDPANGLVQRSGDALPPHEAELGSINLTFIIPPSATARDVYLRVQTTSSRVMQVIVTPQGLAQQKSRTQEWLVGFFIAMSAWFGVWAFTQWIYTRDRVLGVFALKEAVACVWGFLQLGFARVAVGDWFPEGFLSSLGSASSILLVCATLLFLTVLIQTYAPSRASLRACYGLAVLLILMIPLVWLGQPYLALKLLNVGIPLVLLFVLIALVSARHNPIAQPIPFKMLLLYVCCYGAFNLTLPLMQMGLMNANFSILLGTITYTVLDGMVMFILLQVRARNLQDQYHRVALDLSRSQEMAKAEQRHREEQSQLFAMLAHEMKTPLATLRMSMAAGPINREVMELSIADMNQVIERCVHTGQLADQGLKADWHSLEAAALTQACSQSCRAPERIQLSLPQREVWLQTDAQMLSIALGNLLDNACKYAAPNTPIQLTLSPCVQNNVAGWQWRVCNEVGPVGLPDTAHLFEKYYRSTQARRMSGSGLGLFLVKGLLSLMQGSIEFESEDTQAVFMLWVPEQPVLAKAP